MKNKIIRFLLWLLGIDMGLVFLLERNSPNMLANTCQQLSDGYHTFEDLYKHRIELFKLVCLVYPIDSWKSREHSDGTIIPGWFIAGIFKKKGNQITYHLPDKDWDTLPIIEIPQAPEWDGHTPDVVLHRLKKLQYYITGETIIMDHPTTTPKGRLDYYRDQLTQARGRKTQYLTEKSWQDIVNYLETMVKNCERRMTRHRADEAATATAKINAIKPGNWKDCKNILSSVLKTRGR